MAETEHTEPGRRAARRPWFITLVTLGGVVLWAVPLLGGLVGIIAGIAMLSSNRREKKWASLHTGTTPLRQIGELVAGPRVRLQGRVISKAAVTAPVSGRPAVYAVVTGTASVMRNENERKLPLRHLGDVIEIEDGSGRAEIPLHDIHLLSRHVHQHVEHNQGRIPALREHFRVPDDHDLEVEEMRIEPGDELWVEGQVESVEDVASERPEGYRASAARKKVKIGGYDDEGLRVTNVTPEELQRVIAMSPGFTAMGVIWLVAAVVSLAFWGWRFFS